MTELFEKFEVNRDPKWPIISRLVGASLIVHLGLLWLVLYVPAFRDTLNIASLIANTRFVDEDYVATQIGDEVQMIDVQKFRYPDGYFAIDQQAAPGVTASAANDPFAPKIISQWRANEPDPEASPSPSPDASPLPSASPAASASPSAVAANASPSPLTQEEAQKKLEETAAQNDVTLPAETQINKKPLKDFAARANDLKNQGKLDLNKPFEIIIDAKLDENGKLQNARVVDSNGDENLIQLFRDMIGALNDSGFLTYLSPISKDNPGSTVRISVKQGESQVVASVVSETTSPERAKALANALNTMLYFGAGSRAGKDEEVIMKNTNAIQDGKKVVVNFSMPRQSVVDMIKKQMEPGPGA
ncbi:MAG TPA: hypothetical protein VJT15_25000 [Pyrinomonadaceae bacterium]|nr:hypothetical protein [Pyrinomonadaceae bacterium]